MKNLNESVEPKQPMRSGNLIGLFILFLIALAVCKSHSDFESKKNDGKKSNDGSQLEENISILVITGTASINGNDKNISYTDAITNTKANLISYKQAGEMLRMYGDTYTEAEVKMITDHLSYLAKMNVDLYLDLELSESQKNIV